MTRMAKKEKKKKKPDKKKYEYYETKEGNADRKRKWCPKCGVGVFLAEHKDRSSCGKCGYTEFKKQ
jgi:small subunit ribosomal protein S27Ae